MQKNGKFDEGNCTISYQDTHSGVWFLRKAYVHNTKNFTSKINEDKAHAESRSKNHPKGSYDFNFEIRKLHLGTLECSQIYNLLMCQNFHLNCVQLIKFKLI